MMQSFQFQPSRASSFAPEKFGTKTHYPSYFSKTDPSGVQQPGNADFNVDDLFDGDLGSNFKTNRDTLRTNMGNVIKSTTDRSLSLLDKVKNALGTNKQNYDSGISNLINAHSAAMALGRTGYFNKAQSGIDRDVTDAAKELEQYQMDEQNAADLAVNGGIRNAKAMFSRNGGGSSSYAGRLAAGIKLNAATDMTRNIAARRNANRLAARQQQMALDASMFDRSSADEKSIYGDRRSYLDALSSMDRNDQNFIYGQEADINSRDASAALSLENNMANMDREDYRFLLGEQQRYLPYRAPVTPRLRSESAPAYSGYFL